MSDKKDQYAQFPAYPNHSLNALGLAVSGDISKADVTANVTAPATIAAESGHWYTMAGEPYYTVKSKDGTERPTSLRDARKVGAVPSVTTVTKIVASEGLSRYFERQVFDATLQECFEWDNCAHDCLHDANLKNDTFTHIQQASREHGKVAAEKGTALHAAIENYLITGDIVGVHEEHIRNMVGALEFNGIDVTYGDPEKSFAHPLGFGGKVDLHSLPQKFLVDFKSKPCIEPRKRYAYDSHVCQLAAYREGLGLPLDTRCVNVFVGLEDAKVQIYEWTPEDVARGWEMFKLMHRLWCLTKGYEPALEAGVAA